MVKEYGRQLKESTELVNYLERSAAKFRKAVEQMFKAERKVK
jgi:hypothetical protein